VVTKSSAPVPHAAIPKGYSLSSSQPGHHFGNSLKENIVSFSCYVGSECRLTSPTVPSVASEVLHSEG
jgi:hypothetical protein